MDRTALGALADKGDLGALVQQLDLVLGGRMGDILMAANQQPLLTAVSASGNAVFLRGSQVTQ